jgi:propanediol dehydratase large subunit
MSSDPHSAGLLSADTDAESERHQIARWRAMSPAEKLRVVAELNAAADTMALAGIRLRHPGASPREQFLRLASVKLGRDLARQVYPEIEQLDAQ